jgi:hypothetical protein
MNRITSARDLVNSYSVIFIAWYIILIVVASLKLGDKE